MEKFETLRNSGEVIQEQGKEIEVTKLIGDLKTSIEGILGENTIEGDNEKHMMIEHELARIFQLGEGQVKKLDEDFRENMTVTQVLEKAQILWDNINVGEAINDANYSIAA